MNGASTIDTSYRYHSYQGSVKYHIHFIVIVIKTENIRNNAKRLLRKKQS